MTLKYMQGFETIVDDSDLRAQGWAPNPAKASARNVLTIPSVSGVSGFSLRPMGPYNNPLSSTLWGSASANDFGYFNTGITVNQAWLAGGVTFGFGIKFNSGTQANYGAGSTLNSNQACFDGTRYWALRRIGSSTNVAFSTDLVNWTVAQNQPPISMDSTTTLAYMGGGVVAVTGTGAASTTSQVVYYISNPTGSWSTVTLRGSLGSAVVTGCAGQTGNATYPHVVSIASAAAGTLGSVFVGSLGGAMSSVVTFTTTISAQATARIRVCGTIVVAASTSLLASADNTSGSFNTAGAWTTCTPSSFNGYVNDVAYHPTSNQWIIVTSAGIYTIPNSGGSAGTPAVLPSAPAATVRYSTVGMLNVHLVGTTLIATGQQGHIVISADGGNTWTESGGHLLPVGTSGIDWRTTIYDGSRYVLFSDTTSGVIATTPDLQTNYIAQYAQEPAEVTQATGSTLLGTGLIPGNVPSATTGQWAMANSSNPAMLQIGPVSSGSRNYVLDAFNTGLPLLTGTIPTTTQLYHYIEIKMIKAAATANTFTVALYIDGLLAGTSASIAYAGASDTTALLIMVFQRNGVFTAIDDIYVTLDDGVAGTLQGPLGIVNIVAQRGETDTQAQWVKTGSAASNSLSVNQPALSSSSANYVTSANAGDKDIYGSIDALPAGYSPKAIQNEAYFTKTSGTAPVVNIGSLSGSTESDSANATISGAGTTYVSQILEKDPNGNVALTPAAVNAMKFVLNHIS